MWFGEKLAGVQVDDDDEDDDEDTAYCPMASATCSSKVSPTATPRRLVYCNITDIDNNIEVSVGTTNRVLDNVM